MAAAANVTTYFAGEHASLLSSIEASRGGLKRLLADLDPLAAATNRYNQQVDMLDNAHKRGKLDAEQYATAMAGLKRKHEETIDGLNGVNRASGSARAGMQQLSFQLGDVAQGFAAGTSPMVIFAQQSGQVIQAIGLMAGETKGLLGFLGGPWGQVLTAAAVVMTPLVAKLFDATQAEKEKKKAAEELTKAMDQLHDATERQTASESRQRDMTLQAANADYAKAFAARQAAAETYRSALANAERARGNIGLGGDQAELYAQLNAAKSADARVAELQKKLADAEKQVAQGLDTVRMQQYLQVQGRVAERLDKTAAINGRFGRAQDALNDQVRKGTITLSEYEASLIKLERTRDKELKAAQASEKQHRSLGAGMLSLANAQAGLAAATTPVQKAEAELATTRAKATADLRAHRITNEQYTATLAAAEVNVAKVKAEEKSRADNLQRLSALMDRLFPEEVKLRERAADWRMLTEEMERAVAAGDLVGQARIRDAQTRWMGDGGKLPEAKLQPMDDKVVFDLRSKNQMLLDSFVKTSRGIADTTRDMNNSIRGLVDGIRNGDWLDVIAGFAETLAKIFAPQSQGGWGLGSLFGGGSGGNLTSGMASQGLSAGTLGASFGSSPGLAPMNFDVPHLAGGGSMRIGGRGGIDTNVMSINGIPRAMVSADETVHVTPANDRGQPVRILVQVEEGQLFRPVVREISSEVSATQLGSARKAAARAGSQALS